ncbi:MAG: response regulator transcription factor [Gammaproteobacteria bacterium]
MRVLLVEDEAPLRQQVREALKERGWTLEETGDGIEALYMGNNYTLDAVILDLGLPGLSGLQVLRQWREEGRDFPVLILTARGRWQEKVEGLEAGADDYLVKPFQPEELIARLRALVRRSAGWSKPILNAGPIAVDTGSQNVTVNGNDIDLTGFEYRLLEYLALNTGQVISKAELSEHLYSEETDRDSNVLEVLVTRLRRKLDPDKSMDPIETLRGRGYRLRGDRPGT